MKGGTRRRLLALHRWLGIHLGVLLLLVCATGTLAVFGHELDWLLDPGHRAPSAEMNWAAVGSTLERELPQHEIEGVSAPVEDGHAAVAFVTGPNGQLQRALLDPADGHLIGVRHVVSPQIYLRQLHKALLIPKGVYLLGLLACSLLYALLSGLVVYPRWWRKLGQWRFGQKAPVRWSDIHRTGGVWLSAFALIISATGVWYAAEALGRDTASFDLERHPHRTSNSARQRKANLIATADAVSIAKRALPGLDVRVVGYPHALDDPLVVQGRLDSSWRRDRANRVYIDPYDGTVLDVWRADDATLLRAWSDLADELHFGTLGDYGGWWSKLLYFVLGCALCVVIIAGPRLALLRNKGEKKPGTRRALWLRVVTLLTAFVTLACIFAAFALTWLSQSNPLLTGRTAPALRSETQELDGSKYVLETTKADGERAAYVLRWLDTPPVTLRKAVLLPKPGVERALFGFRQAEAFSAFSEAPVVRFIDDRSDQRDVTLALAARTTDDAPLPHTKQELRGANYTFVWSTIAGFLILAAAGLWLLWRPLRHV